MINKPTNPTRPTDCPDWLWADRTARAMIRMGRPVDAVYEAVERLAIEDEGKQNNPSDATNNI